jgi:hypothetical protein
MQKHLILSFSIFGFLISPSAFAFSNQDQPPALPNSVRSAIDECAQSLGAPTPPTPLDASMKEKMDACLKEHGVMPPPPPPSDRLNNRGD